MDEWVQVELAGADLGDERLNERLRTLTGQLSQHPAGGIAGACPSRADKKAAYRFCDNERVEPEEVLQAHAQSTWRRVQGLSRVLIVQDTMELDYSSQRCTQGLGALTGGEGRGYFVHTGLALSVEGVPQGVVHQHTWVRDPEARGKSEARRKRDWKEKESYKWRRTLETGQQHRQPGQVKIYIGDAESDVYALFASAREPGEELLVRSAQNRKLQGEEALLHQAVREAPVAGTLRVEVSRGGGQEPRTARCAVRFREVTLQPPRHADPGVPRTPVRVWAVLVEELQPPQGQDAACWLLLATWPIEDFAGAVECARYYGLRWRVERYHYVLKSGCRLEEAQQRTWERLARLEAVYAVVAWRLLWITYLARTAPESSCEQAFTRLEWQVALAHTRGELPGEEEPAPSLAEMVQIVAKLGGWWGRKGDRAPGVKVLWRGLTQLEAMVKGFRLATLSSQSKPRCG